MVALIPARGGSKGLPGKNKKLLGEKPLIAYTIEAALKAKNVTRVIVSTDDSQICKIALDYGAEVPELRPLQLATDTALAIDVYLYTVEKFLNEEERSHFIVLLPTTPLRTSEDIDNAINIFNNTEAQTVISVTEADIPPSWYMTTNQSGYLLNCKFDVDTSMQNRQNNHEYLIPNGAIYILDYKLLKESRTYYGEKTTAYKMPKERSVDIDTEYDLLLAQMLLKMEI